MRLYGLILICFFGFSWSASAQDTLGRDAQVKELKEYRESLFTQKLNLSSSESAKFFEVFDQYQADVKKAKKAFRNKWRKKVVSELTEDEANEYFNDAMTLQQQELELYKSCVDKLKGVMPMTKIVRVATVDNEVQRMLIKRADEIKLKKAPKKPKSNKTAE